MGWGLLPKEGKFFDYFRKSGELVVECAQEFKRLLENLPNSEDRARKIEAIEHQGDENTHKTMELLHATFITPMDRDDIHHLTSKLDDILDYMNAAAQRIVLYEIIQSTPEAVKLADVCIQSAIEIQKLVNLLEKLKESDLILKSCVEIHRLENVADHILRSAIAKLFKEEHDVKKLIKLKEIYELLETVTDRCEDAADIIEGIVLEYS